VTASPDRSDAEIFASFPGVGPTLTAILLAEIGEDRRRYPSAAALLAEAGLAPVIRSSGSRSVRFRYAANTHLREATMWWAFNSLKTSPWAAAAFDQARTQRGQRYHRALRGPVVNTRWMRILWRCWTDHTTYEPALHTAAAALTASAS
jgi:transposase